MARVSASVRPSFFSSVWNFASLPPNCSFLIDVDALGDLLRR